MKKIITIGFLSIATILSLVVIFNHMNILHFNHFGPWLIKGVLGIIFLQHLYMLRAVSKQATASIKEKAEAGFDKEAFYEKYKKIYESLPEEEKRKVENSFQEKRYSSSKIKTIAAPKHRYSQEYYFFTSQKTPYEILGVKPGDSKAQIKKRYRTLAYKWHPDRFSNAHLSTEELQRVTRIAQIINLAYEFLTKKPMAA